MISAFANTFRVPELRERILFTLAMIVIVRLGVAVTLPGVDASVLDAWADWSADNEATGPGAALGAMLAVFSGGGLQACGIFALGIMPYISASIMIQLMTAVVPSIAKIAREDNGRQKLNQYTRIITIIIAVVQGFLLAKGMENPGSLPYFPGIDQVMQEEGRRLVPASAGISFELMTVLTITAGTMLLMWIGDQMTEKGVGNGVSIIITVNIIAGLPGALVVAWNVFTGDAAGAGGAMKLVLMLAFLLAVIMAVIAITEAQRRIAIQYAKRVVGRKQYGGQTQYLPLKVNYAGVMPIIFASAILTLPIFLLQQLASFEWVQKSDWMMSFIPRVSEIFSGVSPWYYVVAGVMIFFFSFFWVATMFQPSQIAEDLKRAGGYIPGVRPGPPTSKFLDFTMTRLTFAGAIFLTLIFMIPSLISNSMGLPMLVTQFFGGTSLLILVGVVLDVMRQVETHLLQRHYDGFLRQGKIKGGRFGASGTATKSAKSGKMVYLWVLFAILVLIFVTAKAFQ